MKTWTIYLDEEKGTGPTLTFRLEKEGDPEIIVSFHYSNRFPPAYSKLVKVEDFEKFVRGLKGEGI